MLTFFRRIRKGLLGDGATSKYLLYAIGEIALVVIGILIALQINNWNEWKKEKEKERILLSDIHQSLEENVTQFVRDSLFLTNIVKSEEKVLSTLENRMPYEDSLGFHIGLAFQMYSFPYMYDNSSFQTLLFDGMDIIESDSLKKAILTLFALTYASTEKILNDHNLGPEGKDYIREHFIYGPSYIDHGYYYEPVNYQYILTDNYFRSLIKELWLNSQSYLHFVRMNIDETQDVIQLIKNELGEK